MRPRLIEFGQGACAGSIRDEPVYERLSVSCRPCRLWGAFRSHLMHLVRMKQVALLYTLTSPALVRSEYTVPASVESNDVFDGYVSYSIEFASFPDFAGTCL